MDQPRGISKKLIKAPILIFELLDIETVKIQAIKFKNVVKYQYVKKN